MPAIVRGLGLAERVVRRHVAKLEAVGWCERMPAIRGDGSLVWMTASGLAGIGLGQLPAVRAPGRFSPLTQDSVRMARVAADIEHAGYRWRARRELALEPRRWAAQVANERGGYSPRLPDLVFWPRLDETMPVAVVVVWGLTSARRERAALDAWRASIAVGQYAQVRYVAAAASASRLQRVARDAGLSPAHFIVTECVVADESAAVPEVFERTAGLALPVAQVVGGSGAPSPRPDARLAERAVAAQAPTPLPERPAPPLNAGEEAAERERRYREIFGIPEPKARRRWRS